MYIPRQFAVEDAAWAIDLIDRYPFGSLITGGGEYPHVSHIPMVAQKRGDDVWIVGHVARPNPHATAIAQGAQATLVFLGPHAYVSASWYEKPYATVPTWNYCAVHVSGHLRECDAWKAVSLLSQRVEGNAPGAWDPELLDAVYRESQLRAIVAFELRAEVLAAKAKLSQNRSAADRKRVIAHLSASANQTDRACAQAMLDALEMEQR